MNVRREDTGNPDPPKTPIYLPGNCRAEQDCHPGLERSPRHTSLARHHHPPDRGPSSPKASPYQGARNPGSTSPLRPAVTAIVVENVGKQRESPSLVAAQSAG